MILVYAEIINPRIEYIFRLIFNQVLKSEVEFTDRSTKFRQSDVPKINYSYEKFGNEFYIKPHRLLHFQALIQPDIQPVWYEGEKYFFESSTDSDLPFDPFAASFYLVSRYEEYLEIKRGKYKRFPANESILSKYGLLKKPVVNIWAKIIAQKLQEKYPQLKFPAPQFDFRSTIDIDNAWAVAHKGFFRTGGALLKSLSKSDVYGFKRRFRILIGKEKDPYDTYSYIDSVFSGNEEKAAFFFLLGDYARYDKNIHHKNRNFRKLIQRTAKKYATGIHPSYLSSKKKGKMRVLKEKSRLEEITGKPVKMSRQHFLRLKFPRAYRRLLKAGIEEDFSMGYSSQTGFRAGICTPYYWYDLKKDSATNLLVYPFQVMDVTLRDYMRLSPQEAIDEILQLMKEVKNAGGIFVGIWHNETVIDTGHWKGFRAVFEEMNKKGIEWANER